MNEELNSNLRRYTLLVNKFEGCLKAVEEENERKNDWFIFSEKIGRKLLNHCKSLILNSAETSVEAGGSTTSGEYTDISGLFINVRAQMDTYATFHHLFIDGTDMSEKIVRFRLWQLDGLQSRQRFTHDHAPEVSTQVESEKLEIQNIISIIKQMSFLQALEEKTQQKLIKNANWKFNAASLTKGDKLSWDELFVKTGIKANLVNDMHSFFSMHVHSNYISILQNEQLNETGIAQCKIVALTFSSFIVSFYFEDLCSRFSSARAYFTTLPKEMQNVISSFSNRGRLPENQSYFKPAVTAQDDVF